MAFTDTRPLVWPELRAACDRCTGLCCAAYPFIDPGKFAEEKPADRACRHLGADCRCSIHENRQEMGYSGCIVFDCHGAGQRVVGEVYKDIDWRNAPVEAADMFQAFRTLTRIHAALTQLMLLENLPFSEDQSRAFHDLFDLLEPPMGWSEQSLAAFPADRAEKKVQAFAASLSGTEAGRALAVRLTGSSH